jgi:hypothetical protein
MTSDSWKSLIIKIMLMILTPLAAQLHLSMGAADLADIVVLIYGVYRSSGMKLVPHAAVAIDPHTPQDAAAPVGANVAGKVVGALLVAFALSFLIAVLSDHALALDGTTTPKPVAQKAAAPSNPFQTFIDQMNKRAAAINAFTLDDATAAMDMAKDDPTGLACYTAIANKLTVNGGVTNLLPKKLGLLQLIEAARLAKLKISAINTGTDPIVSACAPLILDANATLLMLTGQGAAAGVLF